MNTPTESATASRFIRSALGGIASTALDAALLALALGGLAALAAHARALALLAVWAVGAVLLAVLRPVRTHDPVALDRESPAMMPALLVIPLATPAIAAFGERIMLWPLPGGEALGWLGVALAAAGFGLRIAAIAQLGSRFSPFVAVQSEHRLETSGVYARIRHPGYLGTWLAAAGAVLVFGSALGLLPVAALLGLLALRVRREEALLERHFGADYRAYRARSGALFPRL